MCRSHRWRKRHSRTRDGTWGWGGSPKAPVSVSQGSSSSTAPHTMEQLAQCVHLPVVDGHKTSESKGRFYELICTGVHINAVSIFLPATHSCSETPTHTLVLLPFTSCWRCAWCAILSEFFVSIFVSIQHDFRNTSSVSGEFTPMSGILEFGTLLFLT